MSLIEQAMPNGVCARLETRYPVTYPLLESATYTSLVNFVSSKKYPVHRWYFYREGFSPELVNTLLGSFELNGGGLILDPFCGGGTTLLVARARNLPSVGFETNPFSAFLSKVKVVSYSPVDIDALLGHVATMEKLSFTPTLKPPKLSFIGRLFEQRILQRLLMFKEYINSVQCSLHRDFLKLGWLATLEPLSNYRKAGNGLKLKRPSRRVENRLSWFDVKPITDGLLFAQYQIMLNDLMSLIHEEVMSKPQPSVYEESALLMDRYLDLESVSGVVFSPPYANCFDYTEIYKIELWMGDFISDYEDLVPLRRKAIRSHLHGVCRKNSNKADCLQESASIVQSIRESNPHSLRIPEMVEGYFDDMFQVLDILLQLLRKGGSCAIVVSNSSYGGIIIPTDLLLSRYAEEIGFEVKSINVARFIITSSQQYARTKPWRKYLRESIVLLEKK
jgi:hypothetical protein